MAASVMTSLDGIRSALEAQSLNFNVLFDPYLRSSYLDGVLTTCLLASCCIATSVAVGVLGALAQRSRSSMLRLSVEAYIQVFRNTPPYVQLLLFYFGIGQMLPGVGAGTSQQQVLDSFGWAVVTLGLFGGAFNVEIFRAGLKGVPSAMEEAAEALGYTPTRAFFLVTLPLAARFALPALTGNMVSLLKTTSIASAIAVPEITQACSEIWSNYYNVLEMMIVLFVTYNLLVGAFLGIMRLVERAVRLPGYNA